MHPVSSGTPLKKTRKKRSPLPSRSIDSRAYVRGPVLLDVHAQVRKYEKDHKAQVALARAKTAAEGVSVGQKRKAEDGPEGSPKVRAADRLLPACWAAQSPGKESEGCAGLAPGDGVPPPHPCPRTTGRLLRCTTSTSPRTSRRSCRRSSPAT